VRQSVRQSAPNLEVPQTDLAESLKSVISPACFCLNRGEDSQPAPSSSELIKLKTRKVSYLDLNPFQPQKM
jgi:hypothetical protein